MNRTAGQFVSGSRLLLRLLPAALAALFVTLTAASAALAAAPWESRAYPVAYDLRDLGRVTAVRDQAGYSTCWVMAAIGSLESCLLPQSRLDFSENHLANFQESRLDFEGRASSRISTAYFARWEGPVWERDDPYPRPGGSPDGLRAVRHVQNVLFLPPRSGPGDHDAIKWATVEHGAVAAAMYYHNSAMEQSTKSYYHPGPGVLPPTHYVSIVGWDDRYPAASFAETPPGDGAFLVRNSWGPQWGLDGYFWVSYHDASFGSELAVVSGTESALNYDAVYQHDPLAWTTSLGFADDTAWFANRFRCAGAGAVQAVSFYAPSPGCAYEVRVAGTVEGLAAAPVAAAGSLAVGGYRTVRLSRVFPVAVGDRFTVAVRLTAPGSKRPIAVESPSKLTAPSAARGQSFVSADGVAWTDLTTMSGFSQSNVCLKAFVDSRGTLDTRAPMTRLGDLAVAYGDTAAVAFTVTDSPFSSGSVAVRIVVRTMDGRTVRTRRVPAFVPGQRRTWRFTATMPRGSYRIEAQAWDVAGNRQADPATALLTIR